MTEKYPQILPAPDEANWSAFHDLIPRFTAADVARRTEALRTRIAELEAELTWHRSVFGHISDGEIQTIISNL
ncbi:MAG: hypothetical protein WAK31_08225 [Chthoniobacterales bacterium]